MKFGKSDTNKIMGVKNKVVPFSPELRPSAPGFYQVNCEGLKFKIFAKDMAEAKDKSIKILHAHGITWVTDVPLV